MVVEGVLEVPEEVLQVIKEFLEVVEIINFNQALPEIPSVSTGSGDSSGVLEVLEDILQVL